MNVPLAFAAPELTAMFALAAAALLLVLDRRARPLFASLAPFVVLAVLAAFVALAGWSGVAPAPLVIGLVIALLARDQNNPLHSECAIKLLWVMGASLALSWIGSELLALATGTAEVNEQWGVLALGLVPRMAWSTMLSLSLLLGVVMLGGAPFHFWIADLFQGARSWLAPLSVAAVQSTGAAWLMRRLEGIGTFPDGAESAGAMLEVAAATAFVAGAATLLGQRRPERRVGTLASLQGGLLLATFAVDYGPRGVAGASAGHLAVWSAHLVVALAGAGALARFMPVPSGPGAPGGALFRRHPISGAIGFLALLSLAGVPGTPGAALWLHMARDLAGAGRSVLLLALALGWFAAFATVVQQLREAFGSSRAPLPERSVPWEARTALWVIGAGLVTLVAESFRR